VLQLHGYAHCLISNRKGPGMRFTKSTSLVSIKLGLNEKQPFKNVKINKEMSGHYVQTTSRWPYISL